MWAEFGRKVPFDRRFSLKHSVEASAVGSTSSFRQKNCSTGERGKHSGTCDDVI
jgi:hypothetical protein